MTSDYIYLKVVAVLLRSNFFFFFLRFNLLLGRGEGREKERERNISVPEIHQLAPFCTPPSGDPAYIPGMCPGWELNLQPLVHRLVQNPPRHIIQSRSNVFETNLSFSVSLVHVLWASLSELIDITS